MLVNHLRHGLILAILYTQNATARVNFHAKPLANPHCPTPFGLPVQQVYAALQLPTHLRGMPEIWSKIKFDARAHVERDRGVVGSCIDIFKHYPHFLTIFVANNLASFHGLQFKPVKFVSLALLIVIDIPVDNKLQISSLDVGQDTEHRIRVQPTTDTKRGALCNVTHIHTGVNKTGHQSA